MKHIPWILIFAIVLQACTASPQAVSPVNQTLVVAAATNTPIPTDTVTPTITATFTATSTATITATPTNTLTPTPDQADVLMQKMEEGLVFKDAGTFSKKYGSTEWSISVKIEQENIGEMKDGTFVPYITAVNYPPKALQIIMEQLTAQIVLADALNNKDTIYGEYLSYVRSIYDDKSSLSLKLREKVATMMSKPLLVSFVDNDGTVIEQEINGYDISIITKAKFLEKAQELESGGNYNDFVGRYISENGEITSGSIMTVKNNQLVVYFFYEGTGNSPKYILESMTANTNNQEWTSAALYMLTRLPVVIPGFVCDGCSKPYRWVHLQVNDLSNELLSQQEIDSIIVQ